MAICSTTGPTRFERDDVTFEKSRPERANIRKALKMNADLGPATRTKTPFCVNHPSAQNTAPIARYATIQYPQSRTRSARLTP